ncbi:DNA polymerase III polC-type,DNA polymerase III subunit epsilon,Uncharacterized protein conserved in bacteria,DNA polymerase III, alpha subunit, Gram-positive type,Exonuclease [Chlamydia poikilotherma]|uniref:DNA polymerase III polC-type,DNA polymerase III subunit epsilon,Uncharacterized protein conserved in bacteria,DNA polymerase III, alpha subunit, Gram-positive type,Exonuclease n=2 Tax=Chlamydia TaxID=810 RepID=A0A3B0PUG2_9CHLA|nr:MULTISPECIES: DUF3820 family protein [Chlamydia]QVE48641.1 DUF3820 family protein [Chlamydia crocodili]SYX08576.1 DNA polymerase III polC-type,DNA polymerase III subunit epsilon,Uncharacterized protein conserved in bacteria,DNA polymerase III, alpha subunit, Gram-positive type,Exonuclease [Chlamydia poikilotherma]
MTLLKDTVFVCLDCEMTGLDVKKDRIIEFAAMRFTFDNVIDSMETLINPDRVISAESQRIHRISDAMLKDQPRIAEVFPKIKSFLKEGDYIVGHSVGFDLQVLTQEAERVGESFLSKYCIIDTLRLAKEYGDSPNNSLEALAVHFNVPYDGNHRAMKDVEININIFKHFCKRFRTIEQLKQMLAKPIKMKYMPLGKHKGRCFSEIPLSYLQWASKMDFDADLLFSIRHEIKHRQKGTGFTQVNNPFIGL